MSKLSNLDKISLSIGYTIMVASYIGLYLIFLAAYLNPKMSVLITINTIGEANFELIMLTLSAPFIWVGSKRYFSKELWKVDEVRIWDGSEDK